MLNDYLYKDYKILTMGRKYAIIQQCSIVHRSEMTVYMKLYMNLSDFKKVNVW